MHDDDLDEIPRPELYSPRLRLNKFLAERGICSRRDADLWIESGRVTVNGELVDVGHFLDPEDLVRLDGELIGQHAKPKRVYIALHKPIGVECTTDQRVDGNIVDFVQHQERIFPIGRLDKDSDGLILLTNDGDIVNKVLRAEYNHEKEYWVTVDRKLSKDFLSQMALGVQILRRKTRPCRTYAMSAQTFGIVLTEGMNRQIRKMCEAFGYRVMKLTRVRIMNIEIGHLKIGRWRNLTPAELAGLQKALQAPKTGTVGTQSDQKRPAAKGATRKSAAKKTALLPNPKTAAPNKTKFPTPSKERSRLGKSESLRTERTSLAKAAAKTSKAGDDRKAKFNRALDERADRPARSSTSKRFERPSDARSERTRSDVPRNERPRAARPLGKRGGEVIHTSPSRANRSPRAESAQARAESAQARTDRPLRPERSARPSARSGARSGGSDRQRAPRESVHPARNDRSERPARNTRPTRQSQTTSAPTSKRLSIKDLGWDD